MDKFAIYGNQNHTTPRVKLAAAAEPGQGPQQRDHRQSKTHRRREAGRGQPLGVARRGADVPAGEEADRGQRARHPGQVGRREHETSNIR